MEGRDKVSGKPRGSIHLDLVLKKRGRHRSRPNGSPPTAFPPRVQATDTPGKPLHLPRPRSNLWVCIVILCISQGTPDHTLGRAQKGVEPVSLSFLQAECELDRSFQFFRNRKPTGLGAWGKISKITQGTWRERVSFANASPTFLLVPRACGCGMLLFRLGDHEKSGAVHDF